MIRNFLSSAFAAAALAMAAMPVAVRADVITFDPDGAPGGLAPIQMDVMDWAPGNSLGKGAQTAIVAFAASGGAVQLPFTLFYQAKLSILQLNGNDVTPSNLNAGGTNELTIVAGFQERVTAVGPTFATFDLAPVQTNNFFEIYFDSKNANDLAGTGFNNGTLIMSGTVVKDDSVFLTTGGGTGTKLDAFGTDNYPTIKSVTGIGGTDIDVHINFASLGFFPGLAGGSLIQLALFNSGVNLNFNSVDPSMRFAELPLGVAPLIDGAGAGLNTGLGSITTLTNHVNGRILPGNFGPDIQFQVDANQNFELAVPEPATLTLLALGSLGLGGVRIFRSRRRAEVQTSSRS